MKEEWKSILGYEGYYEVSNLGRVRSLDRRVNSLHSVRLIKGKVIKQNISPRGYCKLNLCKMNTKKKFAVHRLVAQAFISNQFNKPEVNHKDGIKINNRINNLEWVTKSENTLHAYRTGLMKPNNKK